MPVSVPPRALLSPRPTRPDPARRPAGRAPSAPVRHFGVPVPGLLGRMCLPTGRAETLDRGRPHPALPRPAVLRVPAPAAVPLCPPHEVLRVRPGQADALPGLRVFLRLARAARGRGRAPQSDPGVRVCGVVSARASDGARADLGVRRTSDGIPAGRRAPARRLCRESLRQPSGVPRPRRRNRDPRRGDGVVQAHGLFRRGVAPAVRPAPPEILPHPHCRDLLPRRRPLRPDVLPAPVGCLRESVLPVLRPSLRRAGDDDVGVSSHARDGEIRQAVGRNTDPASAGTGVSRAFQDV